QETPIVHVPLHIEIGEVDSEGRVGGVPDAEPAREAHTDHEQQQTQVHVHGGASRRGGADAAALCDSMVTTSSGPAGSRGRGMRSAPRRPPAGQQRRAAIVWWT